MWFFMKMDTAQSQEDLNTICLINTVFLVYHSMP